MKNKILINLYVPSLDETFEIFIPTNETVKKVVDLIVKSVNELSDNVLSLNVYYNILNPDTATVYNEGNIIRDTDIKNGTKIMLI